MLGHTQSQKELVEDIKVQWKQLWSERVDDHVRAEGIANKDYSFLFVEKGTIIYATRKFKDVSFREILEQNQIQNPQRYVPLNPHIGGWGKFVKTHITAPPRRRDVHGIRCKPDAKNKGLQLKKGGRGWLHK